jgi:hypothetical protein
MAALEEKTFFSMVLNFDVLKHRWFFTDTSNTSNFKNRCIDTLNIDVQTILPIPSMNVRVVEELYLKKN